MVLPLFYFGSANLLTPPPSPLVQGYTVVAKEIIVQNPIENCYPRCTIIPPATTVLWYVASVFRRTTRKPSGWGSDQFKIVKRVAVGCVGMRVRLRNCSSKSLRILGCSLSSLSFWCSFDSLFTRGHQRPPSRIQSQISAFAKVPHGLSPEIFASEKSTAGSIAWVSLISHR